MSAEQRQYERLVISYSASLRVVSDKLPDKKATITNLSQGGLCFFSSLSLLQGERIEIGLPTGRSVMTLKASVIWCRAQRDQFSSGAEFVEMSAVRRARLFEMHKAIKIFLEMKGPSGNAEQATAEWLALHAETFLANAP